VPCKSTETAERKLPHDFLSAEKNDMQKCAIYRGTLEGGDATGELFLALDAGAWEQVFDGKKKAAEAKQQHARR
jgi:hypothetical protein